MRGRVPMESGWEYDALTVNGRRWLSWRPGQRRDVKRMYRRRERRTFKQELKGIDLDDDIDDYDFL